MGFESHVERELTKSKSGLVFGSDYWFSNGLKTDSYDNARLIKDTLDESDSFGPCRIIRLENDEFLIEFGTYKQFFDGNKEDYEKYKSNFFEYGRYGKR
jgi:hypothetical protein